MRICYLEYFQLILQKVSFDRRLFNKEYGKARKLLNVDQLATLDRWIQSKNYSHLISGAPATEDSVRSANSRPNFTTPHFQSEN